MKEAIQRLGFDAWADSLIVDAIENLQALDATCLSSEGTRSCDGVDVTIVARKDGDCVVVSVRAYIPGAGWKSHDRTVKLKPREGKDQP